MPVSFSIVIRRDVPHNKKGLIIGCSRCWFGFVDEIIISNIRCLGVSDINLSLHLKNKKGIMKVFKLNNSPSDRNL